MACPSDIPPRPLGFAMRSNYLLSSAGYTEADCAAVTLPKKNFQGAFYTDTSTNPRDFRDGLSQTVMAGESIQLKYDPKIAPGSEGSGLGMGPFWAGGNFTSTHGHVAPTTDVNYRSFLPNAPWPEPNPTKVPGPYVFSSKHPGGVYSLFGDGSVKFLKNGVSANVWYALHTIKNSELVQSSDFE